MTTALRNRPTPRPPRPGWHGIMLLLSLVVLFPGCILDKDAVDPEKETLVHAGDTAPDFTVEMLDGSQLTLSDLRGKVVLLTFWASWCPTCQEEMAVVEEQIIERFAGRPFVFLPVARAESREEVAGYFDREGFDFPAGCDSDGTIYARYASSYIPRHYVIDPDGTVSYQSVDYDEEKFAALIVSIEATIRTAQ
ncbi:MAG TPA: TlpA family protein disulfide reductase [Candidatus Alistipes intestinipullorum]|nr:TlpA family protein disulfide reductase [Candidatus Alistipes intestinipullorum]